MRPPGVKERWEDNGPEMQARILAYYQIFTHDADEREAQLAGARTPFGGSQPKGPTAAKAPSKAAARPSKAKGKARSRRK